MSLHLKDKLLLDSKFVLSKVSWHFAVAQCAQMSLEAEFTKLHDRRKFFQKFYYFGVWGTISKFGYFPKMHLFAWNSAQNNNPRLVECSLEAEFSYLNDEGNIFVKL